MSWRRQWQRWSPRISHRRRYHRARWPRARRRTTEMSVIAVERIKLFSTRSPWWCMIVAAVLTVGFAALTTGFLKGAEEQQATIFITQPGAQLSQMVMMVMAALAVTTEYRFGTIRTSFQAV